MGWQVYATNQVAMTLMVVVWAYRGQYRIEGGWSRLKGKPLSFSPMYLQERGEKLKGVYPGQAGRQTNRPSAELLLQVFKGISLAVVEVAGHQSTHVTPLTPVQQKLLGLWNLPADLFHRLALHCAEPPPLLSER
jgi:transposase